MAKTISINFLENSIVMDDQQEAENKATRLMVDFTGAGVDTWAKWVDYKAADGTGMPVSLGLGVIATHEIPSAVLKKGMLFVQAYAMDGEYLVKGKVFGIQINPSLNITTNTTNYDPTLLETFQQALSDIEMQIDEVYDAYLAGAFDGDSAYDVAVDNGFIGSELEWLASLNGADGAQLTGVAFVGNDMVFTKDDATTVSLLGAKLTLKGDTGATGTSIVSASFVGNDLVFVKSDASTVTIVNGKLALKGDTGATGAQGVPGNDGLDGKSAYEVAVTNGFVGTEAEWLLSLKGEQGAKGDDGYVGADGDSGVYIGAEAPTDPDKTVWIDTDEPYDVSTETILSLVDGSDISIHTHDGRYYTETEMNGLLSSKSNTGHGHAIADVTDLQTNLNLKAPLSNPTFTGLTELPLTTTLGGQDIRTLLMPKNWIINGMFDVWQRGTTQTTIGYGSDDRWSNYNDVSTKTHTREPFTVGQTTVPNNPKYFSRTVVTSGWASLSYVTKTQPIEDVTKLAGKNVALSFWAKADANRSIVFELRQRFGTGGSASVSGIGLQKLNLTTSWQRFTKIITLPSISSKTIGADSSTQLQFWFDAGSVYASATDSLGNQSGTFDIANVSLVEGSVAVECQNQPYADVLRECQRYGEILQRGGGSLFGNKYIGGSAFPWFFKVQKRIPPTLSGNIISTTFGTGANQIQIFDFSSNLMLTGTNVTLVMQNNSIDRCVLNVNATSMTGTNGLALSLDIASDVVIFASAEL